MSGGLKGQWGVSGPQPGGSDAQARAFKAAYQAELERINADLQYTATHVEESRHDAIAGKRDALITQFQGALAQIDPADAAKAEGAISKVLASAKGLAAEVAKFRKEAEAAFDQWEATKPGYDALVTEIEALEDWEDPEAAALRQASDEIVEHENARRYGDAHEAAEALATTIKPIHDAYLKQKEAKAQYESSLEALAGPLSAAGATRYTSLEQKQLDIASAKEAMEQYATDKDYVNALHDLGNLEQMLSEFDEKFTEIEAAESEYEAVKTEIDNASSTPAQSFKKLEAMTTELDSVRQTMETAAGEEDFVRARQNGDELLTKMQTLAQEQEKLEQEKADYEAALVPLQPRIEAASVCQEGLLNDMRVEIGNVQQEMEKAAADEDFVQAKAYTETLSTFLDSLESAEANEIYVVEFNGRKYCGTMAEIAALKAAIVLAATRNVVDPLKSHATANEGQYNDLQALANDQYVIAAVLHTMGGTSLEPVAGAVKAQQAPLDALATAIGADPATAQEAYASAVKAVNDAGKAISSYLDAIDTGGARTIVVLQVVEVTCFAVAAACGAAVLAPAGASLAATMAANGISGAGFGALQTLAEEGLAPAVHGDKVDLQALAGKAALSAVLNGAGGALGAAGGKGASIVAESVIVKLGVKEAAVKVAVKEIVEGGIGNAIQAAVSGTPELVSGKKTWGEFWEAVALNFIAGGIAGRVAGKLGAKQAFDKPLTGAELDAFARDLDKNLAALGPLERTPVQP